jgi:uncharacterized membrane protein
MKKDRYGHRPNRPAIIFAFVLLAILMIVWLLLWYQAQ